MTEQITMENAKNWHVCGLVIQGNPQKLEAIQTALLAIPYTEIPALDAETGKLVVVMQSHDQHLYINKWKRHAILTASLTCPWFTINKTKTNKTSHNSI